MEKHYSLSSAAELLGVTNQTLRNWDNAGKINMIRTPGNQRRVPESEILRLCSSTSVNAREIWRKPKRSTDERDHISDEINNISDTDVKNPEFYEKTNDTAPPVIIKNEDHYILMCKDDAVYDIEKNLILNEKTIPGCLLKKTMSFDQWMVTRYSKETNFSSQRLMQRAFGSYDHNRAAYITGAFSLSDCYWIKRKDDEVSFFDITPYANREWDGAENDGIRNDYIWGSLSNLFVNGKTDKYWQDAETLLKINSFREHEAFLLCGALGLDNTAEVFVAERGLFLNNFTSPNLFFESIEQYGFNQNEEDPREIITERYKEHAAALFTIDYLTENTDRHSDDFGFLRCSSTGEYLLPAPFFNFDWIWTGDVITLPDIIRNEYFGYVQDLCKKAISVADDFEHGIIIDNRANELLRL